MRKQFFLSLIIGLISMTTYGQDIIVKSNGNEIKSEVLEIGTKTIKYKKFNFQDGPTRNIRISDVFMIIYENGNREKFTTSKQETNKKGTNSNQINNKAAIKENNELNKKGNYFSFAPGYGNSYGGLGIRLQYVTKGSVRVGFHGGVGYYSSLGGWVLPSGGIQIYFWNYMYIDAQFGAFGAYENYNSTSYYYDGQYYYDENTNSGVLLGPSLLFGYDWFVSDHFGFNFGTGLSLDVNHSGDVYWAIDGGLVLRF
jgi:hypothetical protein